MNRRVLIRNISLAVAGGTFVSGLDWDSLEDADSYSIVTDNPGEARATLRRFECDQQHGYAVTTTTIGPAPQDFAVVRTGKLVDPEALTGWERDLLEDLRGRKSFGHSVVTAERRSRQPIGTVDFRVKGRLLERISLDESYGQIEIAGVHGATIFTVDNGQVYVRSSSCRHQLCRKCGKVTSGRIVCAPNRLVATVSGSRSPYDAITG